MKQTGLTMQEKGKLGPQWKGPFIVIASNRLGSYYLKDNKGKEFPQWNAKHLKKYFP